MSVILYGSARSRTMRVLWMLEELGLNFDHVPYEFDDPELKSEAFLRLNPAGAIPVLVDGDFALTESLAINLYLARNHSGQQKLYPLAAGQEALAISWSLWAQGHLEPWVQQDQMLKALIRSNRQGADKMIAHALATLERHLQSTDWLVTSDFSVADLNVAGVLSPSRASLLNLTEHPRITDWLQRCYSRPAALRVRKRWP
jgi:glutathione S-transferase